MKMAELIPMKVFLFPLNIQIAIYGNIVASDENAPQDRCTVWQNLFKNPPNKTTGNGLIQFRRFTTERDEMSSCSW